MLKSRIHINFTCDWDECGYHEVTAYDYELSDFASYALSKVEITIFVPYFV